MKIYNCWDIAKILAAGLALVVAINSCSIRSKRTNQSETDRQRCRNQIRSAAYCVIEYWHDNNEQFPNTLEEAVERLAGKEMAELLTQCPAKGTTAKYIYVNWSRWFTSGVVPKDYPLVYESNKSRHGDGINVVLMDESVFWDENARWITDFVKKHPEYELELPR